MRFKNKVHVFNNSFNELLNIKECKLWLSRSSAVVSLVTIYCEDTHTHYVLIGQRGKGTSKFQGYWNLPCGYLDKDESLKDAAIRETFEETGLYVGNIDEFKSTDQPVFVNSDPKDNSRQDITNYFLFSSIVNIEELHHINSLLSNKYAEPDEVSNVKLINVNDVDTYNFCFNHDKIIMQISKFEYAMNTFKILF